FKFERFRNIFGGSLLLRVEHRFHIVKRSQEHERNLMAFFHFLHSIKKIEAVDAGKFNVRKNKVGYGFLKKYQRIFPPLCIHHLISVVSQQHAEGSEQLLFVFKKQNCFFPGHKFCTQYTPSSSESQFRLSS